MRRVARRCCRQRTTLQTASASGKVAAGSIWWRTGLGQKPTRLRNVATPTTVSTCRPLPRRSPCQRRSGVCLLIDSISSGCSETPYEAEAKTEMIRIAWSERVKREVNDAEKTFRKCWSLLASMKEGKNLADSALSLPEFQPRLAEALHRLSKSYHDIGQAKSSLVGQKRRLDSVWFNARMKFLSKQQEILLHAIQVGKVIGDGFAWYFYRDDRQFLAQHLAEPPQWLMSPRGRRRCRDFVHSFNRCDQRSVRSLSWDYVHAAAGRHHPGRSKNNASR